VVLVELIYTKGVHATNNEQLRRAAGISGSQLNHYFPTKESLVLAVIEWQAERVLTFPRSERFTHFESLDSLREWAGFYIAYEHSYQEGCSLGCRGRSWAPNSSNGDEVNVGTACGCPPFSGFQSGRWAGSSSADGHEWGGGPGVVAGVATRQGGRESRSQGEVAPFNSALDHPRRG
jgi:Bacterial regulatory proteins, tetR family